MTSEGSTNPEIIRDLEAEWQRFVETARGFPEGDLLLPDAVGQWSVKDVLGHVATWEDELVKVVERFRRSGEKTDYGDDAAVDGLNEAEVVKQRSLSLAQVWDLLHQSHQRLVQFLQALPNEAFAQGTYTGDWIAMDSGAHYREHREDLERWRTSRA